jgi:hypothetical protein
MITQMAQRTSKELFEALYFSTLERCAPTKWRWDLGSFAPNNRCRVAIRALQKGSGSLG